MSNIYQIVNGVGAVINTIVASQDFVEATYPGSFVLVGPAPQPDPPAAELAPLSRRQLRLALLSIGVTAEDVEAHIAAIADPIERAAAMIEWQDAGAYERDHPLLVDVAAAMELPAEQVDALWIWAARL